MKTYLKIVIPLSLRTTIRKTFSAISRAFSNIMKSPRKWMEQHRHSFSQAGQDYWVYGEVFDGKRGGFFVDIGAYDGVLFSNTYKLEKLFGWKGICVEADPEIFQRLQSARTSTCVNLCVDLGPGIVRFTQCEVLSGIVSEDTDNRRKGAGNTVELQTDSLLALLVKYEVPHVVDYLSIDVEGAEDRIFSTFDFDTYIFRAITIERPSSELRKKLEEAGYKLVKELPTLDCFYIHKSFEREYIQNYINFHRKAFLHVRLPIKNVA